MLASSPRLLAESGDIVSDSQGKALRPPYAMTNKGFEFHIPDPPLPNGGSTLNRFRKSDGLYGTINMQRVAHGSSGPFQLRADQLKWRETAPKFGGKTRAIHVYQAP